MLYTNYCNYNFSNPDYDVIDRPNGIPEYLFVYFQTPMRIRFGAETTILNPGACILIPPNGPTYYEALKHFKNSFVHFSGDEIESVMTHYEGIPRNQVFYPSDVSSINLTLKDIYTEYVTKNDYWEEKIDSLLRTLLIDVSRQLGTSSSVPSESRELYDIFQDARLNILTHPEQPWTSDTMSSLVHLGSSQFYVYYKDFFQRSPKSELLDVRMERAQYLLLHETFNIATVAQYCGFTNLSHFTRYFHKRYNMSPGAFRELGRGIL